MLWQEQNFLAPWTSSVRSSDPPHQEPGLFFYGLSGMTADMLRYSWPEEVSENLGTLLSAYVPKHRVSLSCDQAR